LKKIQTLVAEVRVPEAPMRASHSTIRFLFTNLKDSLRRRGKCSYFSREFIVKDPSERVLNRVTPRRTTYRKKNPKISSGPLERRRARSLFARREREKKREIERMAPTPFAESKTPPRMANARQRGRATG